MVHSPLTRFTGIPLWFVMAVFAKAGSPASLSNFIVEIFWITIVSCLTPWLILLLHKAGNHIVTRSARFLTLLPASFAVALRLLMHTLPE